MRLNAYKIEKYPTISYKIEKVKYKNYKSIIQQIEEHSICHYITNNDIFFITLEDLSFLDISFEDITISFLDNPPIVQSLFIHKIFTRHCKKWGLEMIKPLTYININSPAKKFDDVYINSGYAFKIEYIKDEFYIVISPREFITKDGINYDPEYARQKNSSFINMLSLRYDTFCSKFNEFVSEVGEKFEIDLENCGSLLFKLVSELDKNEYKQIPEPSVSFGGGRENTFPAAGIKRNSPLDYNETFVDRPQVIELAMIGTGYCNNTIKELLKGSLLYPKFSTIYKCNVKFPANGYILLQEEEITNCKSVVDILQLLKSKVTKIKNTGYNIRVCIIELASEWEQFFTGQEIDLHDAIKAEFWKERIPTQIITKKTTDAYGNMKYDNLGLGLYVAAGGKPWRLSKQFKNTVYIGIAFGQVINDKNRLIGIAEIFDEFGQSISMKCMSIKAEDLLYKYYEDKDFHMSYELMEQTLTILLNDYFESYKNWPTEVVIHKTSSYDINEINALNKFKEYPFTISPIHIYSSRSYLWNFIKDGSPPIRGSYYCIKDNKALLYSSGVLHNQNKYLQPGMPYPLLIEDQSNSNNMDAFCEQIMQLTKLNWNSTNTYEREPVTISHARKIIKLLRVGLSENNIPTDIRYFI